MYSVALLVAVKINIIVMPLKVAVPIKEALNMVEVELIAEQKVEVVPIKEAHIMVEAEQKEEVDFMVEVVLIKEALNVVEV
jgi:uncharacterized protein YfkK (UPF0435 family)